MRYVNLITASAILERSTRVELNDKCSDWILWFRRKCTVKTSPFDSLYRSANINYIWCQSFDTVVSASALLKN